MLCDAPYVFDIAACRRLAVGAFTVVTREDIQGTIEAAESLDLPVILQASPFQLADAGPEALASEMIDAAKAARVPVVVQLDHAKEFDVVCQCIRFGFSSVMIDGSLLPYEENVAPTRKVVELAKAVGVSVEGELGHVGGTEDDVTTVSEGLTDPRQAAEFAEATGVDALAVAIGTAHGLYKSEPKIDFARLQEIGKLTRVPIVLHGGSSLPKEILREAIRLGIRKINIGTELKLADTCALRTYLAEHPDELDPRKYLAAVRSGVRALVMEKMRLFSPEL